MSLREQMMRIKKFNIKLLLFSFIILVVLILAIKSNFKKNIEYINIEDVVNANVITEKEKEKIYLSALENFIFTDLQKVEDLLVDSVSIAYNDEKSKSTVNVKLNRSNQINMQQEMLVRDMITLALSDMESIDILIEYTKNEDT